MALLSETVIDIKHWTNKILVLKLQEMGHFVLKMVNFNDWS